MLKSLRPIVYIIVTLIFRVLTTGYPSPQHQELHDTMQDLDRIDFHKAYLASLAKAVRYSCLYLAETVTFAPFC